MKDQHLYIVYVVTKDGVEHMKICIGEQARDVYRAELNYNPDLNGYVDYQQPDILR